MRFPLDVLKFENRSSTSIVQFVDSGYLRTAKLESTDLKDPQQLKYFGVYFWIGKPVYVQMMNLF